jgi:PAS domain S-box-containing protein
MMARKPTYEELEQRVGELEQEAVEHKRTAEKAKIYELMVESAYDVFFKDLKSRYVIANAKTLEAFGLSKDEIIGKNGYEIMPSEEEAKKNTEDDQFVFATGKPTEITKHMTDINGKEYWFQAIKVPQFDDKGNTIGLVGVARDITARKQAEESLQRAHGKLEKRVEERTSELAKMNRALKLEIADRKQAEQKLKAKEAELRIKAENLEEVNTALRVLLKRRDENKAELEEKVLSNVKDLVEPYLEKLKESGLEAKPSALLGILESNLKDIVSPFLRQLSSKYVGLTPAEIRVASLVKEGKTTKEIAQLLSSTTRAVEFHRHNLRKKLGLTNRKANLSSHLLSLQ